MSIKFAVRSEVGRVRTNNEDNFFCNGIFMTSAERDKPFFMNGMTNTPCVFAVFDGMGGEDCGELASLTAAETLAERFMGTKNFDVYNYVSDVNNKICSIMDSQNIRMGTTMALAVVNDNSFMCYNLGDSRIFKLVNDRVIRVSDDHTVAEDKVRMGLMTAAKAERSRERHILTRYLGMRDKFSWAPDSYGPLTFDETRRILLCSDGLTEMVSYRDINLIVKDSADVVECVNKLVETALNNGGVDNVTCVVIEA